MSEHDTKRIKDAYEGLTQEQADFVLRKMQERGKWVANTTRDEIKKFIDNEIIDNPVDREELANISRSVEQANKQPPDDLP